MIKQMVLHLYSAVVAVVRMDLLLFQRVKRVECQISQSNLALSHA
jgi:hypothetical protein